MPIIQNRRRFLTGLTAAGAAGLIGAPRRSACRTAAGDEDRASAQLLSGEL